MHPICCTCYALTVTRVPTRLRPEPAASSVRYAVCTVAAAVLRRAHAAHGRPARRLALQRPLLLRTPCPLRDEHLVLALQRVALVTLDGAELAPGELRLAIRQQGIVSLHIGLQPAQRQRRRGHSIATGLQGMPYPEAGGC